MTNTTETPSTIRTNTQVAQFSLVTPEQFKSNKAVDTAILSMMPRGGPDLTTYRNELLGPGKPDQQRNTFWFPALESFLQNWGSNLNTEI